MRLGDRAKCRISMLWPESDYGHLFATPFCVINLILVCDLEN